MILLDIVLFAKSRGQCPQCDGLSLTSDLGASVYHTDLSNKILL